MDSQEHAAAGQGRDVLALHGDRERTLFFDFLPVEVGKILGYEAKVQIYTVPGQVFYEATRRMVLKGADAVVFVADSQKRPYSQSNRESQQDLRRNLMLHDLDPRLPSRAAIQQARPA